MKRQAAFALATALTASAGLAAAQTSLPMLDAGAQRQAINEASSLLRKDYVFPDLGAQAADRLSRAMEAGDYAAARDPRAFAVRVTQDLQAATHDKHLVMIARVNAAPGPPQLRTNGGFARVDRLRGNIGYTKLDLFPSLGLFAPFADEAMRKLADTDALIIDLRDNGGGGAASVTYFASFFFGRATHVGDLINRTPGTDAFTTTALTTVGTPTSYLGKPVYILTSSRTFSGGEEFADDLQAQRRAVVVGETTGGGANPGTNWPLLDERLRIFIPSSRAENPVTKTNWEGSGVAPDLAAPANEALGAAAGRLVAASEAKGEGSRVASLKARLSPTVGADQLLDAPLMPLRDKPQPGAEAALRKLMADFAGGRPDYAGMGPDIAAASRRMAAPLQADLIRLGDVKSIRFRGVGLAGSDEYDVQYAHGAAAWTIYRMPDGKLAAFGFSPTR